MALAGKGPSPACTARRQRGKTGTSASTIVFFRGALLGSNAVPGHREDVDKAPIHRLPIHAGAKLTLSINFAPIAKTFGLTPIGPTVAGQLLPVTSQD